MVYSPESVKPTTEAVARKKAGTLGIDYHLTASTDDIKKIFYALQQRIKTLPGIEEMADQKSASHTARLRASCVSNSAKPTLTCSSAIPTMMIRVDSSRTLLLSNGAIRAGQKLKRLSMWTTYSR